MAHARVGHTGDMSMDAEIIKAIGQHIVTPICILIGAAVWLYFVSKD